MRFAGVRSVLAGRLLIQVSHRHLPADFFQQLHIIHGLGKKIIRAGVQGFHPVITEGGGADADDFHRGAAGQRAEPADGFIPAHFGHPGVHEDHLRMPFIKDGQGGGAAGGGPGFKANRLEQLVQHFAVFLHIVNDEQPGRRGFG